MGARGPKRGFKQARAAAAAAKEGAATPLSSISAAHDVAAPGAADLSPAVTAAVQPAAAVVASTPPVRTRKTSDPLAGLSAADRENPKKLSGEPLRALAYRRGLGLSAMADMSDEKIRGELAFIIRRQYEDVEA